MITVRIAKDWDWPDLMRQTPGQSGIWDGIRYTLEPVDRCDYFVMLNNRMKTDTRVRCPKENVWAVMQEPYQKGFTDWVVEQHEAFSKVFTHHKPISDGKYVTSPPAIPWHVNKTFDELTTIPIPKKTRATSAIVGDAMDLPGHFKRRSFLMAVEKDPDMELDLFGKAIRYIPDKWDGLAPYKYSFAIENNSGPDLWTEKLADCFLTWTVPFYFGCTNLHDYFPENAYLPIDLDNPDQSIAKIKKAVEEDFWQKNLPAIEEARRLILYKYQLFPWLTEFIKSGPGHGAEEDLVVIPRYRPRVKTRLNRLRFKAERKLNRLLFALRK